MAYVLFDAGTILFGDAPSVFAALDRNRFAAPDAEPGSIIARGAELDATYELWLVLTSPDILSNDRLAGLLGGGEWATDAQGFRSRRPPALGPRGGRYRALCVGGGSQAVATEMTRLTAIASQRQGRPKCRTSRGS
jgi:hypothetical protein